jgi:hypothetical protein
MCLFIGWLRRISLFFCVPLCPVSQPCPTLVPRIEWDRENIEKRAVSPLFCVCPADFANKNQFLGWFAALFGVDRGRNWARLSYKRGANGVDSTHFPTRFSCLFSVKWSVNLEENQNWNQEITRNNTKRSRFHAKLGKDAKKLAFGSGPVRDLLFVEAEGIMSKSSVRSVLPTGRP